MTQSLQKEVKEKLELRLKDSGEHWVYIWNFVYSLNYEQLVYLNSILSALYIGDKESYNNGYNFGYTQGYNDGYSEGMDDGRAYERSKN